MNNDLFEIVGGTIGDALHAINRILSAVDTESDPEGIRLILLICRYLTQQALKQPTE